MARPVTSLEGFVRKLRKLQGEHPHKQLFFRGHSKKEYEIKASVFRSRNLSRSEHLMIRQLIAAHPREFENDNTNFDRLVSAQHYGLPTRLLDVSSNPLVALYFSVNQNPGSDGCVVVFTPEISKQKYYDSDAVSCMSALAFLRHEEKEEIRKSVRTVWAKNSKPGQSPLSPLEAGLLEEFNENENVKRLIQIVRVEKPDFRPILDPIDLVKIVSVVPRRNHDRIRAQSGGFLLYGLGSKSNEINTPDVQIDSFNISKSSKEKIQKELSIVGISEETLFPEIEKSAHQIRNRYS